MLIPHPALPSGSGRRLLAAAIFAASAARADPAPPAQSAVPVAVASIRFEGNHALDAGALADAMLTTRRPWLPWRKPRPFSEAELEGDLQRLRDLYARHGYYEAEVGDAVEPRDGGRAVAIAIRIHEGEPVRVASWTLALGPPPSLPEAEARELVAVPLPPAGSVFGAERYQQVRSAVLEHAAQHGHPAARLEGGAEVELDSHQAHVSWTLRAGPQVRVAAIQITGLVDVDEAIVRRELRFAPQQVYSADALEASRERLSALRLFSRISLRVVRPRDADLAAAEAYWPVEVRLVERPPRSVMLSGGYGTEDRVRVQARWSHRNFLGDARVFAFSAKYSWLEQGVEASLLQRYFPFDEADTNLRASLFRESTPAYDALRAATGVLASLPLDEHWSTRFGHGFEWNDTAHVPSDANEISQRALGRNHLSYLRGGLRYANVDDERDPKRGATFDVDLEAALTALGSQIDYLRPDAEVRGYLPLGPLVLASRLRLATLDPIGVGDGDVPIVKRLFSGGASSVRGFGYQKLGPLDSHGDPIGGLTLAEGSVEVRFPIWWRIGGAVFVDSGQLATRPLRLSRSDFFYSTGGGLRLDTPIGPVRLDIGHVLNRHQNTSPIEVYVSIGQAF